jgi:uncharacterized protein (DUF486 family)
LSHRIRGFLTARAHAREARAGAIVSLSEAPRSLRRVSFPVSSLYHSTLRGAPFRMRTFLLLTISNIFMTFAWYGHLRFRSEALWKVIVVSWGIAFFEYCFQVPANRIGSYEFNGAQLYHSGSHHAFGLLRFFDYLSGRKIPMELRRGLRVHCARGILRVSQVVRGCNPAVWARRSGRQTTAHGPAGRGQGRCVTSCRAAFIRVCKPF